jgi:NAD(P)-dependent dehydrogenase (short-subunit alcohol dehydrogenase family)
MKFEDFLLLNNQVCVIVGAANQRSIGYATAELFAQYGAKIAILDVAITDSTQVEIGAALTAKVGRIVEPLCVQCDIVNPEACDQAIQQVIKRFGQIDCLINCAGIVRSEGMLDIPGQDLDLMLNVNLKGTFHTCQSALSIFIKQKKGSIVNLASVAAQRGGGLVGGAHYAASKGGVISLTKSIAREFGPQGIRANVICPSMTETGMLDGNVNDEQFKHLVAGIPLRRAGKPLDIANACLFLASDLSAYITGHTLDVNGGGHIH